MTLLDNLLGLLRAQQTNRRTDGRQRSSDVTAVLPALSQLRQTTNTLFTRYNRLSNNRFWQPVLQPVWQQVVSRICLTLKSAVLFGFQH